jgi:hypothetical protein
LAGDGSRRTGALEGVLAAVRDGLSGLMEVAEAVQAAPRAPQPPGGCDLLLDGLAALVTGLQRIPG